MLATIFAVIDELEASLDEVVWILKQVSLCDFIHHRRFVEAQVKPVAEIVTKDLDAIS